MPRGYLDRVFFGSQTPEHHRRKTTPETSRQSTPSDRAGTYTVQYPTGSSGVKVNAVSEASSGFCFPTIAAPYDPQFGPRPQATATCTARNFHPAAPDALPKGISEPIQRPGDGHPSKRPLDHSPPHGQESESQYFHGRISQPIQERRQPIEPPFHPRRIHPGQSTPCSQLYGRIDHLDRHIEAKDNAEVNMITCEICTMYGEDRSYTSYDDLVRHLGKKHPASKTSARRADPQAPLPVLEQRPPEFAKRARVATGPSTKYDGLNPEARARHDTAQANDPYTTAWVNRPSATFPVEPSASYDTQGRSRKGRRQRNIYEKEDELEEYQPLGGDPYQSGSLQTFKTVQSPTEPTNPAVLKAPMLIRVQGLRSFQCAFVNPTTRKTCDRAFTTNAYLEDHQKIHLSATCLYCDISEYEYENPRALMGHMRKFHGEYTFSTRAAAVQIAFGNQDCDEPGCNKKMDGHKHSSRRR